MCKCSLTYQTGMDMPASSSRLAIITTCPFFQSRIQRKQVVCEHWNHSRLILPRICALLSILAPKKKKKAQAVQEHRPVLQTSCNPCLSCTCPDLFQSCDEMACSQPCSFRRWVSRTQKYPPC